MRTPEQIYESICNYEIEAGESFLDHFDSSLNEVNLLFWAMGKGYITKEQFHAWEDNESLAISNDDILFGEEAFSIVKEPEWSFSDREEYDKAYEKAQRILAEFLASTKTYQERVQKFFKENK